MAIKFNKLIQRGSERDELEDLEDQATADLLVLYLQRRGRSYSGGVEHRALVADLPALVEELNSDGSVEYGLSSHEWHDRLETIQRSLEHGGKMVFMSHKTGDTGAECEARYIRRTLGLKVYMAEWDPNVHGDSNALPAYIMRAIEASEAFLVHVIDAIKVSMWVGYEIGGAHAMARPRAKIMYRTVGGLPSVVDVLETLHHRCMLLGWLQEHI